MEWPASGSGIGTARGSGSQKSDASEQEGSAHFPSFYRLSLPTPLPQLSPDIHGAPGSPGTNCAHAPVQYRLSLQDQGVPCWPCSVTFLALHVRSLTYSSWCSTTQCSNEVCCMHRSPCATCQSCETAEPLKQLPMRAQQPVQSVSQVCTPAWTSARLAAVPHGTTFAPLHLPLSSCLSAALCKELPKRGRAERQRSRPERSLSLGAFAFGCTLLHLQRSKPFSARAVQSQARVYTDKFPQDGPQRSITSLELQQYML